MKRKVRGDAAAVLLFQHHSQSQNHENAKANQYFFRKKSVATTQKYIEMAFYSICFKLYVIFCVADVVAAAEILME